MKRYIEIIKRMPEGKDLSVIDIGGGAGKLKDFDAGKIKHYNIFDLDKGDDIEKKQDNKKKYDIVVFSHIIEHAKNPVAALRNASGFLKKGGKIILVAPNCDSLRRFWKHLKGKTDDMDKHHYYSFSRTNLHNIINTSGLAIESESSFGNRKINLGRFNNELIFEIKNGRK